MKKIFLGLLAATFSCFLLITQTALATSGACSDHGGANCNVGSDWDGSVICNDGWRDSTVNYAYMDECKDSVSCTGSELDALFVRYKINSATDSVDGIISQLNMLNGQIEDVPGQVKADAAGYAVTASQLERLISAKQAPLIQEYNSKIRELQLLKETLNNINNECKTIGFRRLAIMQLEALQREAKFREEQEKIIVIDKTENIQPANSILTACSPNSTLKNDGKCYCNEGYFLSNNRNDCVTHDVWCSEAMPHSSFSNEINQCRCNDDYWNFDGKCEKKIVYCQKHFGINSIGGDIECRCKEGFKWNVGRTSCVVTNTTDIVKKTIQDKVDMVSLQNTESRITTTMPVGGQNKMSTSTERINKQNSSNQQEKPALQEGKIKKIAGSIIGGLKIFFMKIKFW